MNAKQMPDGLLSLQNSIPNSLIYNVLGPQCHQHPPVTKPHVKM